MSDKCGSELKAIAIIIYLLIVIADVIYGIWLFSEEKVLFGFLIIIGGFIVGWLENIVLYTIGDIWEKVKKLKLTYPQIHLSQRIKITLKLSNQMKKLIMT